MSQRSEGAGRDRAKGGAVALPDPRQLVETGIRAQGRGSDELFEEVIAALRTAPRAMLARRLDARIAREVAGRWAQGWQPADLHRVVARQRGFPEAAMLAEVIIEQSGAYRALGQQVAPRWIAQVDALADSTGLPSSDGDEAWVALLVASIGLLSTLEQLPDLPVLEPPPSAWHAGMEAPPDVETAGAVLDEVRALLAEAESTDFDADAQAFTVRAQELMSRHRFDQVAHVLAGERGTRDVGGRRIRIDDPYADAKASLLVGICVANGARAVWTKPAGFATVFGFPAEVDAVEALFRSLVVQSSRALRRQGSKRDRFGRSRTTRFRRAFLHDHVQRVSRRLRAVADATLEADGRRASLLPVLASRDAAVESAVSAAFPGMASSVPPEHGHGERWVAGTLFGDDADVAAGDLLERRSAS